MVKNLPANTRDARDSGLIPELGRSSENEIAPHSSIFAWRIPWTEQPDRLQSMGSQRVEHGSHTHTHTRPSMREYYFYHLRFIDEKAEAQRVKTTCPVAHSEAEFTRLPKRE